MRICHVITRLIVGGAQENTLLTCEGLVARGHEVTLVSGPTAGPEGSLVDRARHGGYHFVQLPALVREISPARDAAAFVQLRHVFRSLDPDVVHTHSSKAGILGRLAATAADVPLVVHTIHGMSFNRTQPTWLQAAFAELERFCAARTDRLISVADAMTRASLAAGIGAPDQYATIYSGIEINRFDPARLDRTAARAQLGFADDDFVVATVARLFRNKGYEQLIPAMSLAIERNPKLRFVWIGDGAHRADYEYELTRRNLRDCTTLTGLVDPERLPGVLCTADILAHPSMWEGLPRAVVQALLLEIPAISYDLDGAPEVIRPHETGLLVAPGDIAGLADAIIDLAANPIERRRLGRTGRTSVLERFDHRRMVIAIELLYRQTLPRKEMRQGAPDPARELSRSI